MDWIPFLSSYPLWVRVFILAWLAVGVGVLTIVPRRKDEKEPKEEKSASTVQMNQNLGNQQNAQISAGTVNIFQGTPPPPQIPLREQIRGILRTINPAIIQQLDAGTPRMAVMINQTNLPELTRLGKEPAFSDYLEMQSTGSVSMGAHNRIGGHLNDENDVGMLNGFELIFKPSLRE